MIVTLSSKTQNLTYKKNYNKIDLGIIFIRHFRLLYIKEIMSIFVTEIKIKINIILLFTANYYFKVSFYKISVFLKFYFFELLHVRYFISQILI